MSSRRFFKSKGWRPFEFQRETWDAYWEGKSGLLHAATGLGKTLAVYLGPLVESLPDPGGCQIRWLTPLRALAADTLRALREPVAFLAPHLEVEAHRRHAIRPACEASQAPAAYLGDHAGVAVADADA